MRKLIMWNVITLDGYFQGEQSLLRHLVVPVAFGGYIELAAVDLGARSSLVYLPPRHIEVV